MLHKKVLLLIVLALMVTCSRCSLAHITIAQKVAALRRKTPGWVERAQPLRDQLTGRAREGYKGMMHPCHSLEKAPRNVGASKEVILPPSAVFLSCTTMPDENACFYRTHYDKQGLTRAKLILDSDDATVTTVSRTHQGEDPRAFTFQGRVWVMSNFLYGLTLMDGELSKTYKLHIAGKNIIPLANASHLAFLDLQDLWLMTSCVISSSSHAVCHRRTAVISERTRDGGFGSVWIPRREWHARGGTPGYMYSPNTWFGFGHATARHDSNVHKPFFWRLTISGRSNDVVVLQTDFSMSDMCTLDLCDPTSLIRVAADNEMREERWHMITAESRCAWYFEQDHATRLYDVHSIVTRHSSSL